MPAVYDQGQLGSCTANAVAAAIQFNMMDAGMTDVWIPSRLYIYYNARVKSGAPQIVDSGSVIRYAIQSVASEGDCPEDDWPYDENQVNAAPPEKAYDDAKEHKALLYYSVEQNLADMKACLTSGLPFVFGFSIYANFPRVVAPFTDAIKMPAGSKVGDHAVLAVGYDDDDQLFICRNSWSDGWGDGGYFYMPYAYLLDDNLADDFWTISLVK
jgi:C1A family cysteine protease